MARPLRLEFPGALYHVTSRGNARQKIFLDAEDRHLFLDVFLEKLASGFHRENPVRELGPVEAFGNPALALVLAQVLRQGGFDQGARRVEHLGAQPHALTRRKAPVLLIDESLKLRSRIPHPCTFAEERRRQA